MSKRITVGSEGHRRPVIDYLVSLQGFSSRRIKKLIKDKKIHINGKAAYRDSILKNGDLLELDLEEEAGQLIEPQDIPLSIVYEDEYLLAVNKPPFMLVHPTASHPDYTLMNAVSYYFSSKNENKVIRLFNRLDMNTSGLVIIPKSSEAHRRLSDLQAKGEMKKYYKAVVEGKPNPEKGVISKPIGIDPDNPVKRKVLDGGQPSITIYETVEVLKGYSVLKLELVTGRTHQIRVHLSDMGNPIVGDSLYGRESGLIGRQALHASDMEFLHPFGGGLLKLHAEVTEDIVKLINKLKSE